MNAEDILSDVQLIDLTHRDAQFVRAELIDKIDAAIAQAVQAERSRCAETALDCFFDLTDTSTMSAPDVIKRTRHGIAAAIRARSNASEPHALFDDKAMSDEDADMLEAEQEFEAEEFFGIKPAKKRNSPAVAGAGRK